MKRRPKSEKRPEKYTVIDVLFRRIKSCGGSATSAHVYLPKAYVGKLVRIEIIDDE